ncbi:MAG: peptidoglycan/xylan/chitin deacetylase (PgdA/CDA1 family) [Verrucomicrobiales bacterium]|jgi:peptidoglycan/xylan/chitin deacetylase (PgdA/CDA1 family)
MKDSILTRAAIRWIARSGLPLLTRSFRKNGVCVVMFHGVTDQNHSGLENGSDLNIDIGVFHKICRILAAKYSVVSLDEVTNALHSGCPLPDRAVVLTFDDGYASNYHLAYPILRQYGLPATIFLATDFVDNNAWLWHDRVEYAIGHSSRRSLEIGGTLGNIDIKGAMEKRDALTVIPNWLKAIPQEDLLVEVARIESLSDCSLATAVEIPNIYKSLDWSHVAEMEQSGLISFGAHTHQHRIIGRSEKSTAESEIKTSRDLILGHTGKMPQHFAYPNGQPGDHNEWTREILIDLGFRSAVTTENGFNNIGGSDPFMLKRIGSGIDHRHLDVQASGALDFVSKVRSDLRRQLPVRRVSEHNTASVGV